MAIIRFPCLNGNTKKFSKLHSPCNTKQSQVPKGHFAVYVGRIHKTRFVVPISVLEHPLFQSLLRQSEEEFGFEHSMGGVTITCSEDTFIDITSRLLFQDHKKGKWL
uniref:auxin-responsive protein SAUR21-like n=1 Tax=Erigeron canadensis TaxID=72917 RepID=UPI001CB910DB|nr:auxin-responsive protein SAUR21-like [Erigeron canadensis]